MATTYLDHVTRYILIISSQRRINVIIPTEVGFVGMPDNARCWQRGVVIVGHGSAGPTKARLREEVSRAYINICPNAIAWQ